MVAVSARAPAAVATTARACARTTAAIATTGTATRRQRVRTGVSD